MKGSIILILALCIVFLSINGCGFPGIAFIDSGKTEELSINLTNETNATCANVIDVLISRCDKLLDQCNEDLCKKCGDDMARAGGQLGTWACSKERLEDCVKDNSCSGSEEETAPETSTGQEEADGETDTNQVETSPEPDNSIPNVNTCSDGTIYWGCSITRPNYCNNGRLVPNCTICGCPSSSLCLNTSQCEYNCDDNTSYGSCSVTLPKYCLNGTLIDNCTICGCPSDQMCNISICV